MSVFVVTFFNREESDSFVLCVVRNLEQAKWLAQVDINQYRDGSGQETLEFRELYAHHWAAVTRYYAYEIDEMPVLE